MITHARFDCNLLALLSCTDATMKKITHYVHRYTLTVWTTHNEPLTLKDMLLYRNGFERRRIYYDLPDSLRTDIAMHGSTRASQPEKP